MTIGRACVGTKKDIDNNKGLICVYSIEILRNKERLLVL